MYRLLGGNVCDVWNAYIDSDDLDRIDHIRDVLVDEDASTWSSKAIVGNRATNSRQVPSLRQVQRKGPRCRLHQVEQLVLRSLLQICLAIP